MSSSDEGKFFYYLEHNQTQFPLKSVRNYTFLSENEALMVFDSITPDNHSIQNSTVDFETKTNSIIVKFSAKDEKFLNRAMERIEQKMELAKKIFKEYLNTNV